MNPILSTVVEELHNNTHMEIIHVGMQDAPHAVLIRSKLLPTHAILVWEHRSSSGRNQLVFRKASGGSTEKYAVICACCPLARPKEDEGDENRDKKVLAMNREAGERIEVICRERGVTKLFVRHADVWTGRGFGQIESVAVEEAAKLAKIPDRSSTFPFVNWSESTGF